MRNTYILEFALLFSVIILSVTGFWEIYFGVDSSPNLFHHLHVITNFIWLFLLLYQLSQIQRNTYFNHHKVGLSILFLGPWLVATTTVLSVHSAHKGLISGQGDFLIVQNVMVTLETALFIALAFIFKKQRKLHGAFLLSTTILFMGIALFFTLISFVPQYKIEGPETFHRFGEAAFTASNICVIVGLIFFLKAVRHGWPMLLAGLFFYINEFIRQILTEHNQIDRLTQTVGSFNQIYAFLASFIILFMILMATGIRNPTGPRSAV